MPQALRSCCFFLLGNTQSHVVLRKSQGRSMDSIIGITKKRGWPLPCSKSEFQKQVQIKETYSRFYRLIWTFDDAMWAQNRRVCLHLNNFSGHYIPYVPTNIELIYFKQNLTAWVQLLDAGIICCFKAHYWQQFCKKALKWDTSGEADIYPFSLLETLRMGHKAVRNIIKIPLFSPNFS